MQASTNLARTAESDCTAGATTVQPTLSDLPDTPSAGLLSQLHRCTGALTLVTRLRSFITDTSGKVAGAEEKEEEGKNIDVDMQPEQVRTSGLEKEESGRAACERCRSVPAVHLTSLF